MYVGVDAREDGMSRYRGADVVGGLAQGLYQSRRRLEDEGEKDWKRRQNSYEKGKQASAQLCDAAQCNLTGAVGPSGLGVSSRVMKGTMACESARVVRNDISWRQPIADADVAGNPCSGGALTRCMRCDARRTVKPCRLRLDFPPFLWMPMIALFYC